MARIWRRRSRSLGITYACIDVRPPVRNPDPQALLAEGRYPVDRAKEFVKLTGIGVKASYAFRRLVSGNKRVVPPAIANAPIEPFHCSQQVRIEPRKTAS